MKKVIIYLSISILCGCAELNTRIISDVTTFHEISSTNLKFVMAAYSEQEGSLEYKTYAQAISDKLKISGMTESDAKHADVAVFIKYGIDDGKPQSFSIPTWGQTGVSSSYTTGTISNGVVNAYTTHTPTYGVVGSEEGSVTMYTRYLELQLVDTNSLRGSGPTKRLFETKVISKGRKSQLVSIMPYMIESVFKDFPGVSGKPMHYEIEIKEK